MSYIKIQDLALNFQMLNTENLTDKTFWIFNPVLKQTFILADLFHIIQSQISILKETQTSGYHRDILSCYLFCV